MEAEYENGKLFSFEELEKLSDAQLHDGADKSTEFGASLSFNQGCQCAFEGYRRKLIALTGGPVHCTSHVMFNMHETEEEIGGRFMHHSSAMPSLAAAMSGTGAREFQQAAVVERFKEMAANGGDDGGSDPVRH